MFPTSTQKKYWIFADVDSIRQIREKTNREFIASRSAPSEMSESDKAAIFLTAQEEHTYFSHFQNQLKDFCSKFQPPMNKTVIATAFHFFKRFYLYNSVMNYHPKEILVTCVYLACKIEEFNISISQFVSNVKGDREKATEIILNNELLLMSAMNFHLTIHNPYRPVEGFLIDIKTRFSHVEAESLRQGIDVFLDKVLLTDVPLLHSPSQIALAAVLQAASKLDERLDSYVTEVLITDKQMLQPVVDAVRSIRYNVREKVVETYNRDVIRAIEKKLEKCRNQENNPDSKIYKSKMMDELEDEEMESDTYAMALEQQQTNVQKLLTKPTSPSA